MSFESGEKIKNNTSKDLLPPHFDFSDKTYGVPFRINRDIVRKYKLDCLGDFSCPWNQSAQKLEGGHVMSEDRVELLFERGWLSESVLERVYDEDLISLRDFVMSVAWLSHEAKQAELTEEEVSELKSNVGLISVDLLREGIKERHLETYGA